VETTGAVFDWGRAMKRARATQCITANEIEVKEVRLPARHVPHIVASHSLTSYNYVAPSFAQPVDVDAELLERRAAIRTVEARSSAARACEDLRGPSRTLTTRVEPAIRWLLW
jgi:hypothetical protein